MLATRNEGKLRELRALVTTFGVNAIDLREAGVAEDAEREEAIEAFDTFAENALAKARHFSALLPGHCVVADDSGLEVDALGGAPGVRSKRWSGSASPDARVIDAANNALLVRRLEGQALRTARFRCAVAWCDGTSEVVVAGDVEGHIVEESRGAHGFGYDPHFFVDELGMTMAQATIAEKEQVSHRGRAFARLIAAVRERGAL